MWGQLSTTCSNVLEQPNGELPVAVNHNQLRIMASETVDPIDWSHPPPSWAVLPESLVHCINQCNLSGNRTCNRSMRGNHVAYAATQGRLILHYICIFHSKISINHRIYIYIHIYCSMKYKLSSKKGFSAMCMLLFTKFHKPF